MIVSAHALGGVESHDVLLEVHGAAAVVVEDGEDLLRKELRVIPQRCLPTQHRTQAVTIPSLELSTRFGEFSQYLEKAHTRAYSLLKTW